MSFAVLFFATAAHAEPAVLLQSTTSTKNSGLYDHLLEPLKADTGVRVNVVAVGTGQAIRNARNCDGDILLVHSKVDELAFVADGFGVARHDLMYNDFVVVGPANDPAGVAGAQTATAALIRIRDAKAVFASRGDASGTHKQEMRLWTAAGVDPSSASGMWYRETGSGMGATLNIAAAMGAYVLTDRATWLAFANKADLKIVVEGDPALFNQYGVVRVSEAKCPNVKAAAADRVIAWLISEKGQAAIASFKRQDTQLFYPNAKR
ncbi:MAG: substrate-binding domain-containing protein [Pseudomonadota bacterium]